MVSITIAIFTAIGLVAYFGFALDHITDDQNMEKTITSIYHLWIFNVFLMSIKYMLKGFLRSLAKQNSVFLLHMVVQGGVLPGSIYTMCYQTLKDN
jgi:Na+-driven multidrug efflux pump